MSKFISPELANYINSHRPEISKRAYDNKYLVWVPSFEFEEDTSWSFKWLIHSVSDNFDQASKKLHQYFQTLK